MGIHHIAIVIEDIADGFLGLDLVDPGPEEIRQDQVLHLVPHGIGTLFGKILHPFADLCGIMSGFFVEQPFQVAGNEDIHRRRDRPVEFAVPVIRARVDEIGQDIVRIGSADEFIDGQAHQAGIIARQDVAEIPRRYGKVDGIAVFDTPGLDGIGIGAEIIYDLRHQASPVDGVG